MGSKKKKQESDSSSSSESESETSDSSPEKRPKTKSKKRKDSSSDTENTPQKAKKSKLKKRDTSPEKSDEDEGKKKKEKTTVEEKDKEDKLKKRRRSPSTENRDRRGRDDKKVRNERGRFDDRRRSGEYRPYDDRYKNRRPDYRDQNRRDRRDDRDRNRRDDNRNYNRDRDRNRDNYQRRRSRSASFDHTNAKWGRNDDKKSDKKDPKEREKPNFALSGKLTEETNTYRGVVIKYSEPPEARKPKRRWRLYPFKGEKALQTLYIHRESAYLIGRDRKVVDLPVDHPSCSKQHAALQYRLVPFTRDDGSSGKRVRPYIIDLNSANGTFINNKKIESSKYVELLEKDVIKFGFSSREYVLLHENSKDEAQDDDVKQEDEPPVAVKEEK